jgi:ribose transport system ATP-binding protein
MSKENNILLSVRGITKNFPGVRALNSVDFDLSKGEVHALVGENGAGKSTLVKIITGIIKEDYGEIKINDEIKDIRNPHHARSLGIGAIFQELSLINTLSVAENIFLGQESTKSGIFINRNSMVKKTKALFKKYNIDIDPDSILLNLSAAQRQLVEIIKAASMNPQILIMDEPTASLTENEAENLFRVIKDFKENGKGIIYVSHRMDEVFRISDRISILRDGNLVANEEISDLNIEKVVNLMVGRAIRIYESSKRIYKLESKKIKLEVKNISRDRVFSNVSFTVHEGEVLGIAGLVGSGRSELVRSIFGVEKIDSGEIFLNGSKVRIESVKDALNLGMALLPESRHQQGLILKHTIEKNMILPILNRFSFLGFLNYGKTNKFVKERIKEFDIKPKNPNMTVDNLSGGNQQKVVVSKWLSTNPQVLILDEPTAGIDVRTKSEIHKLIEEIADTGVSIIFISSELPELIAHSSRIILMNRGRILGFFNHDEVSQEGIMSLIMKDNMNVKEDLYKES